LRCNPGTFGHEKQKAEVCCMKPINKGDSGITIKRALLSVSDKSGLVELARKLRHWDVELISTGGTCRVLEEAGLAVTEVAMVTGFPEMLDGRVKTLHPRIHGGILARRDRPAHLGQLHEQGIALIDLVVVNLYPFEMTVARPECTMEEAVEQIDIGGPCLIRAAAKNHNGVVVVVDPEDYLDLAEEMGRCNGRVTQDTARRLAQKAFERTAQYDRTIAGYLKNRFGG
jgi:phosphoribosylaminoimidazolecarboxamide formyltransferase/IMP cyclohydrolase